jgi:hypothetical protein
MPTLLTHTTSGIASGAAVYDKSFTKGFWLLSVVCSIIPDADVICFEFIENETLWVWLPSICISFLFRIIVGRKRRNNRGDYRWILEK